MYRCVYVYTYTAVKLCVCVFSAYHSLLKSVTWKTFDLESLFHYSHQSLSPSFLSVSLSLHLVSYTNAHYNFALSNPYCRICIFRIESAVLPALKHILPKTNIIFHFHMYVHEIFLLLLENVDPLTENFTIFPSCVKHFMCAHGDIVKQW